MKRIKAILLICIIFGTANFVFTETIHLQTSDLNECIEVSSFLSNQKGEIFLFSMRTNKVFKFNKNGEFIKSFGGTGVGPGELKRVLHMACNPDNNFLYFPETYSGLSRVSVFDSDGRFKNYMDLELAPAQKNHILKLIFSEDGSFFTIISDRIDWEPRGNVFVTKDKRSLLYFDKKGKLKNTVYTVFENMEMADRPRMGGPRVLFLPSIIIRKTPEGDICIGKTDENEFHFYNTIGAKLSTLKLDMEQVKLSDDEFETTKSKLITYYEEGSRMQWLAKRMIKIDYKPIYENFFVLPKHVAVIEIERENVLEYPRETRVILFDRSGKRISVKRIKGKAYVLNILDNRLYIKEYDEEGDESFRIEDLNI